MLIHRSDGHLMEKNYHGAIILSLPLTLTKGSQLPMTHRQYITSPSGKNDPSSSLQHPHRLIISSEYQAYETREI